MTEIEVKILEINREEVEKKLLELGAKKTFEGELYALMFDFEGDPLIREKKTLRLRKEGEKVVFTYKDQTSDTEAKISHEVEVEVSDFEKMKEILEALGLKVVIKNRKTRTIYELNGTHFALDKYKDEWDSIPEFLEIEAEDIATIDKYASELGFSKGDYKTWNMKGLVEHYIKDDNSLSL